MKKPIFFPILAWLFAAVSLAACSDGEGLDPSSAEPVVAYPYDKLVADLNRVDNLPVVAVVRSEAGLRSVSLSILTEQEESIPVTSVTEFFNPSSYSLSEAVNYKAGYVAALVEVEDLLGRCVSSRLPIEIIDVVEAPTVVFTPEKIEYDESAGGEMPRTRIEVSTASMLQSVEITRVKTTGQTLYTTVNFSSEDPETSWTFDELIRYDEFDRGMKVKAIDNYGQVRISTLSVTYKTVPPPVATFASALILADRNEEKAVEMSIESQAGLAKVELYRVEGKTETLVSTTEYSGEKTLAFAGTMTFTDATSGVKAVVTDRVGRSTAVSTKACVNLFFVEDILVGSGVLADGAQNANRLLSLGDQRTYSVQACFDDPSLQAHADVKVYYMNGNAASVRIYSMENADGKNGEYKNEAGDKNIGAFSPLNATRFKQVDLDFDAATAADIAAIDAATIQSSYLKGKEELIGVTIAFKTAAGSSAGAGCVGLLKLVSISEKVGTNANARVFTFAIKLPKEQ